MTVVIPVLDGAHVLERMAPAVLAQNVERIVYVDDGSQDGTPEVLASLASRDARVVVLTHETNRGRATARNTGVREATGEIVLFLDADVRPEAGWAEAMRRALEAPGAVAAVGRLAFGDLDPADPYHQYLASTRRGIQRDNAGPVRWRHFLTTAAGVRPEAFHRAGGFPERVGYGEDLALACRLSASAREGLHFAPEAGAVMFDPGDLGTALDKVRQFAESLPEIVASCPDALRVAGLERLTSPRAADRLALWAGQIELPARLTRALLPALPRTMRPLAVRYLLGNALATHAPDALARASQRP